LAVPMSLRERTRPERRKSLQRDAERLGRPAIALDADAVVRLPRIAVEREGGQSAFANRYGVNRSIVNAILKGDSVDWITAGTP
jgi:hypothetical protein